MRATSYLSLARNYSYVVILLTYLAVEGTASYLNGIIPVTEARALLVDVVLEATPPSPPYAFEPKPDQAIEQNRDVDIPGYESFHIELRHEVNDPEFSVRVVRGGVRPWASTRQSRKLPKTQQAPVTPDSLPDQNKLNDTEKRISDLINKLRDLYFILTNKMPTVPEKKEQPAVTALAIYNGIESAVLDKRIVVPGLGMEFRSGVASWFIALSVIGLLAQIRNQVRRSFLDPNFAIEEPWLILDGRRGLEKSVATTWAVVIMLAPWISTCCLVALTVANGTMDGWVSGVSGELFRFFLLIAIFLLGGWCSLTLGGELLRLRRVRLIKASQLALEVTVK